MIEIRKMAAADLPAVQALRVAPAQGAFVDPIAQTLDQLKPGEDCHVVVAEAAIVGFFIVDRDYASRFDFAIAGELGLQEYFIDARCQGKGYGKATILALPGYLAQEYPGRTSMVLTVNCRNRIAYDIYLAGGFEDTGALYGVGCSGPQHILRLSLGLSTAGAKSRE